MDPNSNSLFTYHLLKTATSQYSCAPDALQGDDKLRAEKIAEKSLEIESLVLSSEEARNIGPADDAVNDAIAEMRSRYEEPGAFEASIEAIGLTLASLKDAVKREIWATLVMNAIGARAEPASEDEIEAFFAENADKFSVDESRTVRHILVTINDDYEHNTRDAAHMRAAEALARLKNGEDFAAVAKTVSECPTAVEGGVLGRAPRGKLYKELDDALFAMDEGALAGPIETEMGFHILRCDAVHPPETATFDEARPSIADYLNTKHQQQAQRDWLASLAKNKKGD